MNEASMTNMNTTLGSAENALHASTLQSRNIRVHKRRTSIRLEPEMWDALNEIARLESCSIHDLSSAVFDLKAPATSFTASLRVFMMEYYRSALQAGRQMPVAAVHMQEPKPRLPQGNSQVWRIQQHLKMNNALK
jgi:predicted DNA-binding ribbon-helix-helix protein